jgi:threonine/homoserine/homoserine lactone efflux protein
LITYLIQGLGYGFAAAAQPGPFQTYVISRTLRRGWRAALPAALAPLISDGPIILVALLVLNQLPEGWQPALYLTGGLFVLYLAWGAFKAWQAFDLDQATAGAAPTGAVRGGLLKAALTNALSPGPYLFWSLVTGPILLAGWRADPAYGIAFLLGFYGAMIGALVLLILLFSLARHLGPSVNRALVGLSALALALFGLYQIWQGVEGLVVAL